MIKLLISWTRCATRWRWNGYEDEAVPRGVGKLASEGNDPAKSEFIARWNDAGGEAFVGEFAQFGTHNDWGGFRVCLHVRFQTVAGWLAAISNRFPVRVRASVRSLVLVKGSLCWQDQVPVRDNNGRVGSRSRCRVFSLKPYGFSAVRRQLQQVCTWGVPHPRYLERDQFLEPYAQRSSNVSVVSC